jgi:hypothetical protein
MEKNDRKTYIGEVLNPSYTYQSENGETHEKHNFQEHTRRPLLQGSGMEGKTPFPDMAGVSGEDHRDP